jgi:hypothetical protein
LGFADSMALSQIGGSIVAIQHGLDARLVLMEMAAAAEVAATKAAHVPAAEAPAKAAHVPATEAARMAAA